MTRRGWVWAALLGLSACGKEVGSIPMTGPGEAETSVSLKAKQRLALWTKLDVSWEGSFDAHYTVELRETPGAAAAPLATVATATCDPLDVGTKLRSVETNVGAHHSRSYSGKMRCELVAPVDGAYTVHAKLEYDTKPATLSVKDISLVLKI